MSIDFEPHIEFMKEVMTTESNTAIQDGLLIAFNDAQNNQWIVENKINKEPFEFRDFLKRTFWKKR